MFRRTALRDLCALTRPAVSAAAAGLAGLGFLLAPGAGISALAPTVAGIFLLACGASICNQVQEKDRDALMLRTRNRPLPAGRMRPGAALVLACLSSIAGLLLLFAAGGPRAVCAGLVPLVLYNGLYTPLKARALSLIPGVLAGALPFLVGLASAGGDPFDTRALLVFSVAVVWQVPHFWLRAMRHKDDYLRAGFAVPFLHLSPGIRARAALLWPPALGAALLLPAVFFRPAHPVTPLGLGAIAVSLCLVSLWALRRGPVLAHALRVADIAVCIGLPLLALDMGLQHL